MSTLTYFAYGSNMLRERLLARNVVLQDTGQPACANGCKLLFNKTSDDGSSKANLVVAESGAKCWGVLFSVDSNSLEDLDNAEGAPNHFRRESISVMVGTAEQEATTYLAQANTIRSVPDRPYDWYLALILAGAKACVGMPSEWIAHLRQTGQSKPDTKTPRRKRFTEAVDQLKAAGYVNWRELLNPMIDD